MSEDIYSQFLRGDLTESAASTLTEGTAVMTGASVNRVADQNIALEIHSIGCTHSHPEDAPAANSVENSAFCLSTRSGLTTMPEQDEEHVIYKNKYEVRAGVATYLPMQILQDVEMPHHVEFKHPLLISHPKIYPYLLTTNSGTAGRVRFIIAFTYVLLDRDLAIEALESFR